MTLQFNNCKKLPRALLQNTVRMTIYPKNGQEMAQNGTNGTKWHKMDTKWIRPSAVPELSLECQMLLFPQFHPHRQLPSVEDGYIRGRIKSVLKRQEANFLKWPGHCMTR
jgi:hypothetical protein